MAPTKGDLNANEKLILEKISQKDLEGVKELLGKDDVRLECLDEQGMTFLQHAAFRGSYEICKLLLEKGADVNSQYHESGYTALMFAALLGKLETVSLLLEHGASTTARNSVNRTASQMAAFVNNHQVVSLINNFLPREKIDYYTQPHGLQKEGLLTKETAEHLYRLVVRTNIHPVSVALYIEKHMSLLDKKVVEVLEHLCDKMINEEQNDMLGMKCHYLAFIISFCIKQTGESRDVEKLRLLVKSWLKGRESDGFPETMERFLRQCIREFKYRETDILKQAVVMLKDVQIGDEPSAVSLLTEMIRGQKGFDHTTCCEACGEPNAKFQCAKCKTVSYCEQACQKMHWFTHKKHCPRLLAEREKQERAIKEEEDKQRKLLEEATGHTLERTTESAGNDQASKEEEEKKTDVPPDGDRPAVETQE